MAKRLYKYIVLVFFVILGQSMSFAQERIPMKLEKSGIYTIPCEVNGLKLSFVFDTGASAVHISLIEAAFMLKNGYITEDDFIGTGNYSMADGSIAENALINLKSIKIGNTVINNVTACVSSNINASLLLGQSAIQKLGKYAIDGNYLILYNSRGESYSDNTAFDNQYQLWLTLSEEYETGTFEEFREYLSNSDYRWKLYNEIFNDYDLPNFPTFSSDLGFDLPKNPMQNLRNLYSTLLVEDYSVPPFEEFKKNMQEEDYLYSVYSNLLVLEDKYDHLPSFEQFKKDMGYQNNSQSNNSREKSLAQNVNYFLAQVSSQVNLREGPGTNFKILSKVPKGSYVLLTSDDNGQTYRKVLYVDKNIYGYVSNKYLTNIKKLEKDASGNLQAESRTYKSTADIKIKNNTTKNATINVGSNSYKFKPHETRTITNLKPGQYSIMASAPGVIPFVAVDNIEAGYEYSWEFYITTIRY